MSRRSQAKQIRPSPVWLSVPACCCSVLSFSQMSGATFPSHSLVAFLSRPACGRFHAVQRAFRECWRVGSCVIIDPRPGLPAAFLSPVTCRLSLSAPSPARSLSRAVRLGGPCYAEGLPRAPLFLLRALYRVIVPLLCLLCVQSVRYEAPG